MRLRRASDNRAAARRSNETAFMRARGRGHITALPAPVQHSQQRTARCELSALRQHVPTVDRRAVIFQMTTLCVFCPRMVSGGRARCCQILPNPTAGRVQLRPIRAETDRAMGAQVSRNACAFPEFLGDAVKWHCTDRSRTTWIALRRPFPVKSTRRSVGSSEANCSNMSA
jgi:hypothetical protein